MHKSMNILGFICLLLLGVSGVQAANSYAISFSESNNPAFSGFYGNLGVAYNMLSSSVDYAGIIQYNDGSGQEELLAGSANKSAGAVSGLFKLGYSFRLQSQIYLGFAGFYNLQGTQSLTSFSAPYNSSKGAGGVVNVKEEVAGSYGFLLQPGYILANNKSAIYLNLGMEFIPITTKTNISDYTGTMLGDTDLSSSKTISAVKLGVGYQQHLNLGKFKGSNNLTWFAEANYTPTTSVNISQGQLASDSPQPPYRYEQMKAKLGNTQLVVGINYYF